MHLWRDQVNIEKVQSHLLLSKFLFVSFIESLRMPERLRGRKVRGGRKNDRMGGQKMTHLYEELQLPVIQEMDLTSPPLCHLWKRQEKKRMLVNMLFQKAITSVMLYAHKSRAHFGMILTTAHPMKKIIKIFPLRKWMWCIPVKLFETCSHVKHAFVCLLSQWSLNKVSRTTQWANTVLFHSLSHGHF